MPSSSATLQALGLNISQNQMQAPEGSLIQASNVLIRRNGVIESRRGYKLYGDTFGTSSDRLLQLIDYKNRLIRHYATTLQYDNGSGTFTSFSGSYSPTQTGLRIKSVTGNGNLYFTTADGIKKISATNGSQFTSAADYITNAGGVKAVDLISYLDTTPSSSPWFLNDSTVAYRVVWGSKDINENLILGTPSERSIIYNYFEPVVVQDMLNVLGALDNINQTGSLITDGNYINTLKLPISAPATDIRTNLVALAAKLDNDILFADVDPASPSDTAGSAPLDLTGASYDITSNIATITFAVTNPSDYLSTGDKFFIAGMNANLDNGGTNPAFFTVSSTTSTTLVFNYTHANVGSTGITTGTIVSYEFRDITAPAVPSTPATHEEIQNLQDYLDSMIVILQGFSTNIISILLRPLYIDPLAITAGFTTTLEITIPSDVTTNNFLQIYRTTLLTATGTDVLSDLSPNDEMRLVYEANPTQAELTAGIMVVEDVTPDDFAGANLYTNPSSGEGILQGNDIPPFAKDINRFKDYTFYANTRTKYRYQIQLLGVANMITAYGLGNIPTFTITNGDVTSTYRFVTGVAEETPITCVAKASVPAGSYFTINSAYDKRQYYVWFDTTGSDTDPAISGRTGIKVDISSASVVSDTDVAAKVRDYVALQVYDFTTASSTSTVTITNVDVGAAADASAGTSTFTIGSIIQGRGERCTQEINAITCVADVAGSLAGKYFLINSGKNENAYYVWYKVSGAGSDPAIANRTGLLVNVSTNDTATAVATATAAALSTLSTKFTATSLSAVVTSTNVAYGPSTNATAGTSGFTISISQEGALDVLLSDTASVAQAVDQTIRSLVRITNLNKTDSVYAFNISSTADLPGKILLESKDLSSGEFYPQTDSASTGNSFSPAIAPVTIISSNSTGANTIVTTSTAHGLASGDFVVISNSNSLPSIDGLHEITVTGGSTFTIPITVVTGGTAGSLSNALVNEVAENEEKPNRVYYSKFQQPEAVPILNYLDVGAKDQAITRIIPLRDSLFVFKEDGLYRISGEIAPFQVTLFDNTTFLFAPDSPGYIDNQIICWTDQGVTSVTESGANVISRGIDTDLVKIQTFANFGTATFGHGYHSDNSYIVYTVKKDTDTEATIAYRYGTLTNSWTTFDRGATCGLVKDSDDKNYLGAADKNQIEVERKTFSRRDYADREISKTIDALAYSGSKISFSSVSEIAVGDVLYQTQYVTMFKYNMLLKKLDRDSTLSDTNYYSTLIASNGNNMSGKLDSLIVKVRDDAGRLAAAGHTASSSYTALLPTSSTFSGLQTNYNAFVTLLNNDAGVGYSDYASVTDSTEFETIITAVDTTTKKITLRDAQQFIQGPVLIYKSIPTAVTWSAQTMGDPLMLKQIFQATLMLESRAYTDFTLGFATDLLPSFESVSFTGDSSGAFGVSNAFGDNFFGGVSNAAPLRTIIPLKKQRCRYMLVKYTHQTAFEKYSVLGITLTGNVTSVRGFR